MVQLFFIILFISLSNMSARISPSFVIFYFQSPVALTPIHHQCSFTAHHRCIVAFRTQVQSLYCSQSIRSTNCVVVPVHPSERMDEATPIRIFFANRHHHQLLEIPVQTLLWHIKVGRTHGLVELAYHETGAAGRGSVRKSRT
jgi:hypothetical protein